jgi:hypothetical protein
VNIGKLKDGFDPRTPDTRTYARKGMDFQFDEKKLKFVQRVLNNRVLFKIVLLFQVPINFMIWRRR